MSANDENQLLATMAGEREANRTVVLLASMGIGARLEMGPGVAFSVYVSPSDLDEARRLLAEDDVSVVAEAPAAPERSPEAPARWFGRGAWAVVALAAACIALFAVASKGGSGIKRSRLLELGAIESARIDSGELWRLLTAVFLHFDAGHLLANLAVLTFVGPPLAHQVGASRFVLVFLASGIGGNVVSHLASPAAGLKAGASGAIAGTLGALGGRALARRPPQGRKPWQTLGALAALYGMLIGFGPRSDHAAHVGGLLCGVLLGRWLR